MSAGQVYFAPQVDREKLEEWLGDWFQAGGVRLGTRADDTALDRFDPGQASVELDDWPQGRVFDKKREVRWEARSEGYDVWLLGESISPPPELEEVSGPWTAVVGKPRFYLWGRYDKDWSERAGQPTWIEVRIPRPLHYPLDEANAPGGFARLGHVDYHAPNGAVQFTRLTEVR
jgi:hypothetical protein